MSKIWSASFWKATAERTIGTAAATFIAAIGSTALFEEVTWPVVGSTVALASILTVAKSVVAGTGGTGPGIGKSEALTDRQPTHRADV